MSEHQSSEWWVPLADKDAVPGAGPLSSSCAEGRTRLHRRLVRCAGLGGVALLLVWAALILLVLRGPADPGDTPEIARPTDAVPGDTAGLADRRPVQQAVAPPAATPPARAPSDKIEAERLTKFPRLVEREEGEPAEAREEPEVKVVPVRERREAEAGPPAEIVRLIEALADKEPRTRRQAARLLGEQGRAAHWAIPALAKALRDRYPEVRRQAGQALAQIGPASVPELIRALRERDGRIRQRAARSLAAIGPDASAAVKDLVVCLRDSDPVLRIAAVLALGEIGPEALPSVPDLVRALSDQNETVCALAVEALRTIGPGATRTLGQTLSKGQPKQRRAAAQALGLLGRDGRAALTQLRQALRDSDPKVRAAAAQALGRMGTNAKDAADDLLKALNDKDLRTQVSAATTLVALAPSVPGLLDKIREADRKGRWSLPQSRTRRGPVPAEEVARLEKQLDAKDPQKRLRAALALALLAPRSRQAVKALIGALEDTALPVRLVAADALTADGVALGAEATRVKKRAKEVKEEASQLEARARVIQDAIQPKRMQAILRSWQDRDLQARLDRFMALFISKALCSESAALIPGRPAAVLRASLVTTLDNLGPEAIPALVRGFNLIVLLANTGATGFC